MTKTDVAKQVSDIILPLYFSFCKRILHLDLLQYALPIQGKLHLIFKRYFTCNVIGGYIV